MQQRAAKVDKAHVEFKTNMAKKEVMTTIDLALKIQEDPEKAQRKADQKCVLCFYVSTRLGGAAITERPCGLCGGPQTFSSTATDELCAGCAERNQLCKQCGGDVDLKQRQHRPDV